MRRYKASTRSFLSSRRAAKKSYRNLTLSLLILLIFAYGLLTWLLPAFIGGLTALSHFKDKPSAQKDLSETTTLAPPVLNIPYEATNSATIKIKGFASPHLSVEVYVDDTLAATAPVQDDGSFLTDNLNLSLGVNNITSKAIDDKGNKSLPSKNIRIIYDNNKPKLEISSPGDGQVVKGGDKKITVSGTTDPGIDIRVNNSKVIVDENGIFSKTVDINEGDNTITITASDLAGNSTSTDKKVTYLSQ